MYTKEQKQEIYNKVRDHLLAQGKRAGTATRCLYRHGNLKCAIGSLIPDEAYDPAIEGDGVSAFCSENNAQFVSLRGENPIERAAREKVWEALGRPTYSEDAWFLHDLQDVHDNFEPSEWPKRLQTFAARYELTP